MTPVRDSIQGRVLALVVAAAVALWTAVGWMTWQETRHELDELLDAHLAQSAALLVTQQLPGPKADHTMDAPVLHRYAPRVAFQVFHEGRLVLRSPNAPPQPLAPLAQVHAGGFRTVHSDGAAWRVFATRAGKEDTLVLVAEEMRARSSILAAILENTLGPLVLGLPALVLALWWSIRRALRPMDAVGRRLAGRRPDDFTPVDAGAAPAEMRPMLEALNQLFARIAALLASERRFIADAAHELRTPLAAIRAQAQVAVTENDARRRRHALEATLAGCDRASRLAEQLLALSRVEAIADLEREPLDLTAVAREVLADLAGAALAKDQQLSLEALAPGMVCGNAALVAVLVRNLVDNAIRYAPAGAAVQVSVRCDGTSVELAVDNGGPPVAAADLHRLGQRFFRVLGTDAAGTGLGLSIVGRIADLHGAVLRFGPSRLGGLRAAVAFARAP
jgi:two-component system sensor histidine kinase QseC